MKIAKIVFLIFIVIGTCIMSGPRVKFETPVLLDTNIYIPLSELESYIAQKESKIKNLKADNQARIIWADENRKQKTEFSLVYLHGFSSSQKEGDPLHIDFAKRYGLNLYLARLEDHGRADTNSFKNITPENLIQSAEDAINIGKLLGNKVIVMSCSTGGTLSAILAAAGDDIHSMIMYSPNIDIYDQMSDLLLYPWGKQMSNVAMGGEYNRIKYDTIAQKYWNSTYHTNGIFALKTIINEFMTEEHFKKISIPVFIGYYFKDEDNQDKVVSVSRMLDFYNQISTPDSQKLKVAFPNAAAHVISSSIFSKDVEGVKNITYDWAEKTLKLKPILFDLRKE